MIQYVPWHFLGHKMTDTAEPPRRLLTLDDVLERVRMSKTQLYRAIRDGRFPKPK
jgi:predicted DNA-binding transcriptional regulator AlpA